ncbi:MULTISPECIES: aminotransferase class V-fold PLP-dependent enzyme [unclassified Haloferax]|uniref:aminotransferase class V-fold PLP-dependent enzyme n=1 Tax=unclassified Haloferax TaxID=2625095 RepID=UPI0028764019|nr:MULTISPECIES: aminotransferase class V-fold PLP-dependent enzyme [unclassified Haloferax]MDS0243219.1 aminotransferase class V-fold PLP-dependent enzyme [Haloferax sp. S2CR25]MDS0446340.1 aminotransferase class V-fold PLP-dependent enzyme [Haloferax sp. S2CR25-2]
MTPAELRASIPALDEATYLNTGAHGPSPRAVVERVERFLEYHEYESPADDGPYSTAFATYEDVRADVADFLGADASEIALTQSTTDGINRIATTLDWSPGDVVVRTDLEHPAGILPWRRLEREGVEVRVVESENGRLDRDQYTEAVEGASLVCFSAVTWNYGTRLPVGDLVDVARDAGALTLVDAVQAIGQLPVDVHEWGADVVAGAGHKWLLGPWGAGFLYVRRALADRLEPRAVGYRGVTEPTSETTTFKPGAPRFEIGTTSPAVHVGLREAIDLAERVGLDRTEDHITSLADRFVDAVPVDRLVSPHTPESGLVTIDVDDPAATVDRLAAEGVVVRALPEPNAVRASFHSFNDESDVDTLLDTLANEW